MKIKQYRRIYVVSPAESSPLPSPAVPMELQALEHQLSSLSKAKPNLVEPHTSLQAPVNKKRVYDSDVGKRRRVDRTFLPGDHDYSALGGVLMLSRPIRTN